MDPIPDTEATQLRRGIEVFTRLLAHEDDIEAQEQTQEQQQGQEPSAVAADARDHFSQDFIINARLPFATTLQSLSLGDFEFNPPTSSKVGLKLINRVLRCLPRLLDFSMNYQIHNLDVMKGLGRHRGRLYGGEHVEGAERESQHEIDSDEVNMWSKERPLLCTLSLKAGLAVHIEKAEEALRWQFRRLEDVDIQCTEYEENDENN
ncbi:hypothetical protein BG011_008780 [Mortierella polycephala]|uniref:Uncharacterized protein n=1 Tax=Mortierella polycephala TaxID=41804 RepID=A0A9P6TWU4_9FUNG|nr:hypothetical protein BG011_008780 [Mortierella polycephala]